MSTKQPIRKSGLGKGITSLLGGLDVSSDFESGTPAHNLDSPKKSEIQNESPRVQGASVANESLQARVENTNAVLMLPLDSIIVNPHQPRRFFNDSELKALAASIKIDGVIQPVTVTKTDKAGRYILIAGERRLRASKIAGMSSIPAILKNPMSDQEQLRIALIENIQRQDINVIEEAEAYQSLIKDFGLTQEQCADKVGKERSTVANILRMTQLPREVQDDLVENRLTMGHARALLSIEDKKIVLRARDIIIKKSMGL
ncbi:MAG: ParB/RepB/Spo0J family partition protein [Proteobacteria bacterium]|nr:ParB/RepB/Spo0J family partition protein [Pseudomonadota bacterium]